MKMSYANLFKSTVTLGVLIIISGICLSASQCSSNPKTDEKKATSSNKEMNSTKEVTIRDTYTMQVPSNFEVEKGEGDDTQFLKISSPDQDLIISYESGPGTMEDSGTYQDIQSLYSNILKIETKGEVGYYFAYKEIDATFRSIEGKVFVEDEEELQEILRISSATGQMDQLQSILATLKIKN